MRVTFSNPLIQNMSGKVSKDSDMYYRTVNGVTYLCQMKTKTKTKTKTATDAKVKEQRARLEKFKRMVAMANEIMHTVELKKQYMAAWKKQKKYRSLRGYIAHCVYQDMA